MYRKQDMNKLIQNHNQRNKGDGGGSGGTTELQLGKE